MRKLIIVAAALGALTLFQNCSKATYGSKAESLQQQSGGTGNGYDGKIYAVLGALPCPDSTYIESAILVKDPQQAYLLREFCQSVPPRPLAPAAFTVISENQVAYNGVIYTEMRGSDLPPLPTAPDRALKGLCTRKASMATDGFDGIVQMEIDAREDVGRDGIGVGVTMQPYDGSWLRQAPFFTATKFSANSPGSYSLFAQTSEGGVFNLTMTNGSGTGFYRLEGVIDVFGVSGRPKTEEWSGSPFSCGNLPW